MWVWRGRKYGDLGWWILSEILIGDRFDSGDNGMVSWESKEI